MSFRIRLLKEEDLEKGFLETLTYLTKVGEIKENLVQAKTVFNQIKDNQYIFVALDDEEQVIGTASILIEQKFIHNGSSVGHIEDVVVRKEYERQSIGKSMIEKCIQVAHENNCYKIILDCKEHNARFYSKLGFHKEGVCFRLDL